MIHFIRICIVAISVVLWHYTQKLLARRNVSVDSVGNSGLSDQLHTLTRRCNQRLLDNPAAANRLLIASSFVIDALGIGMLVCSILGRTIEPFFGLMMVFALRQICQAFCPLPPPDGMIWRSPGVPSLLVTYGTHCDLFFSGHTAIAVYGAATLASGFGPIGLILGIAIALFEIGTVVVLRAHYTMDIFTGVIVALYVHSLAVKFSPAVDICIRHLAHT